MIRQPLHLKLVNTIGQWNLVWGYLRFNPFSIVRDSALVVDRALGFVEGILLARGEMVAYPVSWCTAGCRGISDRQCYASFNNNLGELGEMQCELNIIMPLYTIFIILTPMLILLGDMVLRRTRPSA